jgi:PPM family protein phosphatase
MTLSLRYAARSDIGLVRSGNEDSGYAGPRLLVVADGMGGHAAGEVASSIVVASMAALDDDDLGGDLLDALAEAVDGAEKALSRMVDNDTALEGMGTTLTALLWSGPRVGLAHVGDSRAYLLRGGDLLRLTHDHTYVQTLVDAGRLSKEEAEQHPRRSLLIRALDGRTQAQPDLSVREVRSGDRFLVCSDGLTGVVSEETLRTELAGAGPAEAAEKLVALALRSGGPDNVTVIVADVVDTDIRPDTVAEVVGAAGDPTLAARAADAIGDSPAARARTALSPDADAAQAQRVADRVATEADHERRSSRRRWVRRGLVLLGVLALLAVAFAGFAAWVNAQYYVGVKNGQVTVYRGVQQSIAGQDLSRAVDVTEVPAAGLPTFERERVEAGIAAASRDDAERIADRLRGSAASCAVPSPPAGCPGATS